MIYLNQILKNDSWSKEPAYIVGGGASLKGFDFRSLSGKQTIGINRAYEEFIPTINYSRDRSFVNMANDGKFGIEAFKSWLSKKFIRLIPNYEEVGGEFVRIKASPNFIDNCLTNGICLDSNSGNGAIRIAAALGAKKIYLLGFDNDGTWWHNGYPHMTSGKIYPTEDLEKIIGFLEIEMNVEVIKI